MRIIRNPREPKLTFEDLKAGDVFLDSEGHVCVKIRNNEDDLVALWFEENQIIYIDDLEIVTPLPSAFLSTGE